MEELQNAGRLLRGALDRYLTACTTFSIHYDPKNALNRLSQSLSDGIVNELQFVNSSKLQVLRAEAIIGQTRNATPALSPISTLPSDLLLCIFQLVARTQPCIVVDRRIPEEFHDHTQAISHVCSTEALSHVCSSWRQIVLSVPSFWSHIDLSLRSPRLLARAQCFATRAKHSLLDLHIGYQTHRIKSEYSEAEALDVCALIAPRMRSLQLSTDKGFLDEFLANLRSCLENCTPGTLTELKIWANLIDGRIGFFGATSDHAHSQSYALNSPHLEDVLLGVTTLRLYGAYPYWTSKAYHGLVELHLRRAGMEVNIPESQLVHILTSSPQLRIFSFGLSITNHLPYDTLPTPVSLESLEVLDLSRICYHRCQTLLRWIAPGSNPLHVSLGFFAGTSELLFGDVFTRFNARSNISQLDLRCDYRTLSFHRLLVSLPKLRVLRLRMFRLIGGVVETRNADGQLTCRLPKLDALHIQNCDIVEEEFRQVAKIHSIHTLTVSDSRLYPQSEGGEFRITKDTFEKHLSGITPVAKFISLKYP